MCALGFSKSHFRIANRIISGHFAGPGELDDDPGRGERLPAAVGHLRRPPQGPQVRLRPLRRRPHVLRHRPPELARELPRHVVPAGWKTHELEMIFRFQHSGIK